MNHRKPSLRNESRDVRKSASSTLNNKSHGGTPNNKERKSKKSTSKDNQQPKRKAGFIQTTQKGSTSININNDEDLDDFQLAKREHLMEVRLIELLGIKKKTPEEIKEIGYYISIIPAIKKITDQEKNVELKKFFLAQIGNNLKLELKPSNTIICIYGEKGYKFYTILNGRIAVLVPFKTVLQMTKPNFLFYLLKLKYYHEYELIRVCLEDNKGKINFSESFVNFFYDQTFKDLEPFYINYDQPVNSIQVFSDIMEKIDIQISKFENNKGIDDLYTKKRHTNIENEMENNTKEAKKFVGVSWEEYIARTSPSKEYSMTKLIGVNVFVYKNVRIFKNRDSFGEVALESDNSKRTATCICFSDDTEKKNSDGTAINTDVPTNSNVYIGSLTKEIYSECLKAISEKIKEEKFNSITQNSFLNHLNFANFNRSLNQYFQQVNINKGEKVFDENINKNDVLKISMLAPVIPGRKNSASSNKEFISSTKRAIDVKKIIEKKIKQQKKVTQKSKKKRKNSIFDTWKESKSENKRQSILEKLERSSRFISAAQVRSRMSKSADFNEVSKINTENQSLNGALIVKDPFEHKLYLNKKRISILKGETSIEEVGLEYHKKKSRNKNKNSSMKKLHSKKNIQKTLTITPKADILDMVSPTNKKTKTDFKEIMNSTNHTNGMKKADMRAVNKKTSESILKISQKHLNSIKKDTWLEKRNTTKVGTIEKLSMQNVRMNLNYKNQLINELLNKDNTTQNVYFITKGEFLFYSTRSLNELAIILKEEYRSESKNSSMNPELQNNIYHNEEMIKFDPDFEKFYMAKRKFKFQIVKDFEIVGFEDSYLVNNKPFFSVECESSIGEYYEIPCAWLLYYLNTDIFSLVKKKNIVKLKREYNLKKMEELYSTVCNQYRREELQKDGKINKVKLSEKTKFSMNLDNTIKNTIGIYEQKFELLSVKEEKKILYLDQEKHDGKLAQTLVLPEINFVDRLHSRRKENVTGLFKHMFARKSVDSPNKTKDKIRNSQDLSNSLNKSNVNNNSRVDKRKSRLASIIKLNAEEDNSDLDLEHKEIAQDFLQRRSNIVYTKIKSRDAEDIKLDNNLIKNITTYIHYTQKNEFHNKIDIFKKLKKAEEEEEEKEKEKHRLMMKKDTTKSSLVHINKNSPRNTNNLGSNRNINIGDNQINSSTNTNNLNKKEEIANADPAFKKINNKNLFNKKAHFSNYEFPLTKESQINSSSFINSTKNNNVTNKPKKALLLPESVLSYINESKRDSDYNEILSRVQLLNPNNNYALKIRNKSMVGKVNLRNLTNDDISILKRLKSEKKLRFKK